MGGGYARVLGVPGRNPPEIFFYKFSFVFSVATLSRFVARVRIEDSSRNRFSLNGIQRDFFGGFYPDTVLAML